MEKLKELKTLLDYECKKSNMQIIRIEKILNTVYRVEGIIISNKAMLLNYLLEGYQLEKRENYTYYKKNGELSKPKTLYMLSNESGYIELKKIEYDFLNYCIDNNYITYEAIMEKDQVEYKKKLEKEELEKEEEKRIAMEKKENQRKKELFDTWLYTECNKVPDFQKEIMDKVFLYYYSKPCTDYSLALCINYYDKEECKQEVIDRLYSNSNKASIKIFECLTSIKLPRGCRERVKFLEKLSTKDFEQVIEF